MPLWTWWLLACVGDWVYRQLEPAPPATLPAVAGLPNPSAATCGACHTAIYEEWAGSSKAEAFTDPLFQTDWQDQGELFLCLHCHAPLQNQQPLLVEGLARIRPIEGRGQVNPHFDPDLQNEGVTCAACHLSGGAVVGPLTGVDAPHVVRVDPDFASEKTCESCHQLEAPPFFRLERDLIDTVGEWREWKSLTGREESCVDCHMPTVTRPLVAQGPERVGRQHVFHGLGDEVLMASALDLEQAEGPGGALAVLVRNKAGHRIPSGEFAHRLWIDLICEGPTAGHSSERWELGREIRNRREIRDTSLAPAEERILSFALSMEDPAGSCEVQAWFQKMGQDLHRLAEAGLPDTDGRFLLGQLVLEIP